MPLASVRPRTLDSSEMLVAANARVLILNYELIDESPAFGSLPTAINAVQKRGYQLYDTIFVNDHRRYSPSPVPGVLLYDPRYAYGDIIRSGIVIAQDYILPGPERFRSFQFGRYFAQPDLHNSQVISENCRHAVHEAHLARPNGEFNSLSEAITAAEQEGLAPFDTAFVNVSHGGSDLNEPLPVILLGAPARLSGLKWGEAFIGRVGSQHLLYRWNHKDGKGAYLMS